MQEKQFIKWLENSTSLKEGPRRDAVCRCKRVVNGLSVNLDEEWEKDECCSLLTRLEYSYDDKQRNKPLPGRLSIRRGNYISVMSCLRSAVRKYCEFKDQTATKNSEMMKNKNTNTENPTIWLVYAKRQHCRHEEAIHALGFINWTENNVNFRIGDIVYLFFNTNALWKESKIGSVKFKAKVEADNFPRQKGDARFWEPGATEKTLNEPTFVLRIEEEYTGEELTEIHLQDHGFPKNRIQCPVYGNHELINYIATTFAKSCRPFPKREN